MLHYEIASIIKKFLDINQVDYHTGRLKQGFKMPCMYFPIPMVDSNQDSLSSYTKSYSLTIKVFEEDSEIAFSKAMEIQDILLDERLLINIINEDGSTSDNKFRLKNISIREITDGVMQITINWDSRYRFAKDTFTKINKFNLSIVEKE